MQYEPQAKAKGKGAKKLSGFNGTPDTLNHIFDPAIDACDPVVSGQWLYNFIKSHTVQSHKKVAAIWCRMMICYREQAESRNNNTTVINKKSIFFSLAQLGVKAALQLLQLIFYHNITTWKYFFLMQWPFSKASYELKV